MVRNFNWLLSWTSKPLLEATIEYSSQWFRKARFVMVLFATASQLFLVNSDKAYAEDSRSIWQNDWLIKVAFGPRPSWFKGDTSQHLLRWSQLSSIDVVGRENLAPPEAASEFDKALLRFSQAIDKPVNRRLDFSISDTGELSDRLALDHSRIGPRILVIVAPFTDDNYLNYLANSILGGTGEGYEHLYIAPMPTQDLYLSRTIYFIKGFDIDYAVLVLNSKIFAAAYANVYSTIHNTIYTYLTGCLSPLFLDHNNIAHLIALESEYKLSGDELLSRYVKAIGEPEIKSGMGPSDFEVAIHSEK